VSPTELQQLRTVDDVVRLGRAVRVEQDRLHLERGEVPLAAREVVVDCTASGLRYRETRPVFEPGRITLQMVRPCQPAFAAALTGYVAATRDDLAEANALCHPHVLPDVPADWVRMLAAQLAAMATWRQVADVQSWIDGCRLDLSRGMTEHLEHPRMQAALARFAEHVGPAAQRLQSGFAPEQRKPDLAPSVPAG
jgi:hypothetical protein